MRRDLALDHLELVASDHENPFVRYRQLLHAYHLWRDAGRDDASFVALVERLDAAVATVEGHGFRRTPLRRHPELDAALGLGVWVKDETLNVSGSHKGRHLFGLAILLAVVEALDLDPARAKARPLAVASCGNAALAAGVIAAALRRQLHVFVPQDAEASTLERLRMLGTSVTVCGRDVSSAGDPCYERFRAAVEAGAVPFGCQGPDNGLTVEGAETLAWEVAEELFELGVALDRLIVQVGGGALASACAAGIDEAARLGVMRQRPVLDTVEAMACAPLARAVTLVRERRVAIEDAMHARSHFMWPWESEPASVARGILDHETYDWACVAGGVVGSGGTTAVVDEATLKEANTLARRTTGIDVDHTGSAGLAGLLQMSRGGSVRPGEQVVVIFSGAAR